MAGSHTRKRTDSKGNVRWLAVREFTNEDGKRSTHSKTFDTKRDAKAWVAEFTGKTTSKKYAKPSTKTLAEFLNEWNESLENTVSASTRESYSDMCKWYLKPMLGQRQLVDLERRDVKRMIAKLISEGGVSGKKLSTRTVKIIRSVLSIALEEAREDGLVSANVARGVKVTASKKDGTKQIASMSQDEARRFEAALDDEDPKRHNHRALFIVLLHTGLRPSEALALRWQDLDLDSDEPTLSVNRTLQLVGKKPIFDVPKTANSIRTLSLDAKTTSTLLDHRRAARDKKLGFGKRAAESLVFHSRDSRSTPLNRNNVRRSFLRIAERAGLVDVIVEKDGTKRVENRFTLYSLRHTAASLAITAGVPIGTVSANLGHKSVSFTFDTYVKVGQTAKRDAAKMLGDLLAANEA